MADVMVDERDGIVTSGLAEELRAIVRKYATCHCDDCREIRAERCDDVLDEWLVRTGRG